MAKQLKTVNGDVHDADCTCDQCTTDAADIDEDADEEGDDP
jgi:hypothetical protein